MAFTADQLYEKLNELEEAKEFYWGEPIDQEIEGIGKVETVLEYERGYSGEDTNTTIQVFKVGDRYFKMEGFYDSWNGTDWDGPFTEVKPVKVEYTEYHAL